MTTPKRKITKTEVSQQINLRESLGRFSKVPEIRDAFLQGVIDTILERTARSRDIENRVFAKYSKAYKDSVPFQVFGKTDKVNMDLTGDMLGSIEKTDESRDTVTIAVTGEQNILKAFAHITGFEGHKYIKGVQPRDFFGITDKEIQKLTKGFEPNQDEGSTKNDEKIVGKLLDLLDGGG